MSGLVVIQNRQAVTTSLQVAESFKKRHDNVIRDIEVLKKDVLKFEEMFYEGETPDSYGRPRKTFYMNRDGFTLLAMGFNGKKALEFKLKYIDAFNKMEEHISNVNLPIQMAKELAKNEEAVRFLAEQVAQINTVNNQYHEQTNNKLEAIDKKLEGEYVTPQDLYAIEFATKVKAEKFVESSGVQITLDSFLKGDIYEQARASKREKEQLRSEIGRMKRKILVAVKKHLGMKGNDPNNHIRRKDVDRAIQFIKNLSYSEVVI
ncbi:Rha family transcriptional regulator [Ureibacillus galli]|uniref:Rha family transcriptional regulator n=1 Tax=Ureibacillus galli TaxID=2762222 RepID=UPI001CD8A5C2|nr:Rha family transcriptional regulator [Ureibacillus galli]